MGKFWEADQEVAPEAPQQQGSPVPVIALPDYRGAADQRDDARLQNDDVRTGIAQRDEADKNVNDAVQNASTLQTRYEQLPPVKEYRAIVPLMMQALQLPDDPTADNTLLYRYSKVMDPGSVVRESEQGMAAGGGSVFDTAVANLKKQLGIEGGGSLTPEIRSRLKRDIVQAVQEAGQIYRQQRQRFGADAQAYGIDPARVIGPDDFSPYAPTFNKLMDEQHAKKNGVLPAGVADPDLRGGLPVGSDIEYGMDKKEGPFDRERFLQQNYGITGDQEARMVAFWNQNRGNPNLTVEGAKQWFAATGMPAPADAAIKDTIGKLQKGYEISPIDTSGAEQAYRSKLQASLQQDGFDPTAGASYGARAVRGAEMGLSDEIQGVGGAIGALFSNEGVADGYRFNRDKTREAFAQMEDQQGKLGYAAEFAGGLAGGGIGATRAPITASRAMREGAAMGALAGYGYGEGGADSLGGAVLGGATGAALGLGVGKGAETLAARRAAMGTSEGAKVIGAADSLNAQFGTKIAPIPADVAGTTTRRLTGAAAQFPLATGPIIKGAENVTVEGEAARDAIAKMVGSATTDEAAAESALTGAAKYIGRSKTKVDALYAKARKLGGSEPVDLSDARQVLDDQIAELSQTPGGAPGLAEMQGLRTELDRAFPVEGVKRMRTTLRDRFMKDGLRSSDLERRMGMVVDAAEGDIVNSLARAGKTDAAKAYQGAAAAHKERVGLIDDVLTPFIGKNGEKSAEDVMKAIDTATKTKGARLGKFLGTLPHDDAATVRATIISRLGKSSAERQDAAGDAFSLPQFLTHWNRMSNKAKGELFGGETRAALENLAKVAEGTKEAQRFANFSNTGSPIGLLATGANGAGFLTAPITSTLALLGQYGCGKLLASPSFARWLAKMPANPGAIPKHVSALARIAANDNVIAQEALGLKSALEGVLGRSAQNSAAAPSPSSTTQADTEQGARQ